MSCLSTGPFSNQVTARPKQHSSFASRRAVRLAPKLPTPVSVDWCFLLPGFVRASQTDVSFSIHFGAFLSASGENWRYLLEILLECLGAVSCPPLGNTAVVRAWVNNPKDRALDITGWDRQKSSGASITTSFNLVCQA